MTEFKQTTPPKTWLVESILVTLLCCLPFGIVGIINASKVESKFNAGDVQGAIEDSENAKKWVYRGAIAGVVIAILYIIFVAIGLAGGVLNAQ